MKTGILHDPRPIKSISTSTERWETGFRSVSSGGVTKIEPYEENGPMGPVLWFAIYSGKEIIGRINAFHVVSLSY